MKTEKQVKTLLKSYETRRDNLIRRHSSTNGDSKCWDIYKEIIRYNLKIQTLKVVLK